MIHNSKNGFTLVEVLLYSVILAMFLGVSFPFAVSLLGTIDTLFERSEVVANQEFVERKLGWFTIQTNSITTPPASSSSNRLELSINDSSLDPAVFSLENNSLMLSLAGATSVPITNNRVNVIDFQAEHVSPDQLPSELRISLSFQSAVRPDIVSTTTLFYALYR